MKTKSFFKTPRAFTLLEILAVLAIMGLIAAVALPVYIRDLEDRQIKLEDSILDTLKRDIISACESPETAINPAVFSHMPDLAPTVWSENVSYLETGSNDWFTKIALFRGAAPGTASPKSQPVIASVLFNPYGQPRLLLAGPSDEPNAQRFVLVSLMERGEKLALPSPDGSLDYFEALYSAKDWNTRGGSMPGYLAARLTPSQLAAWMPGGAIGGKFFKLRVLTFSIPKYRVTVSNNHAEVNAYVSYDFGKSMFTSAPESGVTVSPPILSGQTVRVYKGKGGINTAVETYRVTIRENFDVIVQNQN